MRTETLSGTTLEKGKSEMENMQENMVQEAEQAPLAEEKMVPQSQVNAIIQKKMAMAADKARKEAEQEYMSNLQAAEEQRNSQQAQPQRNEQVSRDVDAESMYQQVQEKFNADMQKRQMESEMSNIADSYLAKVDMGKDIYDDFEDITGDFDATAFPKLVYMLAGIDNAADVLYELNKNPQKLVTVDALAEKSPKQAHAELLKLSRSIAENRTAQAEGQQQGTNAPLDRLNPSRTTGNNGKMSTKELRNQPWLRG